VALDKGRVIATQNNGIDFEQLSSLILNVKNAVTAEISTEDAETVSENLAVIEEEVKRKKPRKYFLKTAITGLQIIKGSAEFGVALVALFEFIKTII